MLHEATVHVARVRRRSLNPSEADTEFLNRVVFSECVATTAYLLEAAEVADSTANRSLDVLRRRCQAQTTKRDCLDVPQMAAA